MRYLLLLLLLPSVVVADYRYSGILKRKSASGEAAYLCQPFNNLRIKVRSRPYGYLIIDEDNVAVRLRRSGRYYKGNARFITTDSTGACGIGLGFLSEKFGPRIIRFGSSLALECTNGITTVKAQCTHLGYLRRR